MGLPRTRKESVPGIPHSTGAASSPSRLPRAKWTLLKCTRAVLSLLLAALVGGSVTACAAEDVASEPAPEAVAVPAKGDDNDGVTSPLEVHAEDSKVEPARFRSKACTCPPTDPLCEC